MPEAVFVTIRVNTNKYYINVCPVVFQLTHWYTKPTQPLHETNLKLNSSLVHLTILQLFKTSMNNNIFCFSPTFKPVYVASPDGHLHEPGYLQSGVCIAAIV